MTQYIEPGMLRKVAQLWAIGASIIFAWQALQFLLKLSRASHKAVSVTALARDAAEVSRRHQTRM